LAAGLLQHPVPDVEDHAVELGQRDEVDRGHGAAGGVLPPHEGLDADHLVAGQVHQWLVEHSQLSTGSRFPQIALELVAFERLAVQDRVEHRSPVRAPLGGVHGDVGLGQQVGPVLAAQGYGDADAGHRPDLSRTDEHDVGEGQADPVSQP
jgi:hypothetical protein